MHGDYSSSMLWFPFLPPLRFISLHLLPLAPPSLLPSNSSGFLPLVQFYLTSGKCLRGIGANFFLLDVNFWCLWVHSFASMELVVVVCIHKNHHYAIRFLRKVLVNRRDLHLPVGKHQNWHHCCESLWKLVMKHAFLIWNIALTVPSGRYCRSLLA